MKNLDLLIPTAPKPPSDWWSWATVTTASPLRVRLDGETAALAATPDATVRNLAVNDRVWVQVSSRRIIVLGKSGGQTVDTSVSTALVPSGAVMPYAGATAPANYLLCDGSAVSRTTYAALYAVVGTTYGVGDNSTTFNLPDLRARLPLGAGTDPAGDGGTITRGTRGGNFKITAAELPAHTHAVGTLATSSAGGHDHALNLGSGTGSSTINIPRSVSTTDTAARGPVSNDGAHTHTITGATASTGSGTAHLPPYVGLNYIIKT